MLDADNTLWQATRTPVEVWQSVLSDMGVVLGLQDVEASMASTWPRFMPRWHGLELSGSPNDDVVIRSFWLDVDAALLNELGLDLDLETVEREASRRFTQVFRLYPETATVLARLAPSYRLAIVSNNSEPLLKARHLGIDGYIHAALGSIHVGHRKPMREMFELALSELDVGPKEAVMVGDSWDDDVVGAENAGVTALHLRRGEGEPTNPCEISDLWGLVRFLDDRREE